MEDSQVIVQTTCNVSLSTEGSIIPFTQGDVYICASDAGINPDLWCLVVLHKRNFPRKYSIIRQLTKITRRNRGNKIGFIVIEFDDTNQVKLKDFPGDPTYFAKVLEFCYSNKTNPELVTKLKDEGFREKLYDMDHKTVANSTGCTVEKPIVIDVSPESTSRGSLSYDSHFDERSVSSLGSLESAEFPESACRALRRSFGGSKRAMESGCITPPVRCIASIEETRVINEANVEEIPEQATTTHNTASRASSQSSSTRATGQGSASRSSVNNRSSSQSRKGSLQRGYHSMGSSPVSPSFLNGTGDALLTNGVRELSASHPDLLTRDIISRDSPQSELFSQDVLSVASSIGSSTPPREFTVSELDTNTCIAELTVSSHQSPVKEEENISRFTFPGSSPSSFPEISRPFPGSSPSSFPDISRPFPGSSPSSFPDISRRNKRRLTTPSTMPQASSLYHSTSPASSEPNSKERRRILSDGTGVTPTTNCRRTNIPTTHNRRSRLKSSPSIPDRRFSSYLARMQHSLFNGERESEEEYARRSSSYDFVPDEPPVEVLPKPSFRQAAFARHKIRSDHVHVISNNQRSVPSMNPSVGSGSAPLLSAGLAGVGSSRIIKSRTVSRTQHPERFKQFPGEDSRLKPLLVKEERGGSDKNSRFARNEDRGIRDEKVGANTQQERFTPATIIESMVISEESRQDTSTRAGEGGMGNGGTQDPIFTDELGDDENPFAQGSLLSDKETDSKESEMKSQWKFEGKESMGDMGLDFNDDISDSRSSVLDMEFQSKSEVVVENGVDSEDCKTGYIGNRTRSQVSESIDVVNEDDIKVGDNLETASPEENLETASPEENGEYNMVDTKLLVNGESLLNGDLFANEESLNGDADSLVNSNENEFEEDLVEPLQSESLENVPPVPVPSPETPSTPTDSQSVTSTKSESTLLEKRGRVLRSRDQKQPPADVRTVGEVTCAAKPGKPRRKSESDVSVPGVPKPHGFINLGNTCYMNCVLQCVLTVPSFKTLLKTPPNPFTPSLFNYLSSLLQHKFSNGGTKVKRDLLVKVKNLISDATSLFKGSRQQDAHEFLGKFLDVLREERKLSLKCPVARTFQCEVVHTLRCVSCRSGGQKREQYYDFSLNLPGRTVHPHNLAELLDSYFATDEVELKCSTCGHDTAQVQHRFSKLPHVLVLHVQRYAFFKNGSREGKRQDSIAIPTRLDITKLSKDCLKDGKSSRVSIPDNNTPPAVHNLRARTKGLYSLHAVISHLGESRECGHYICDVYESGQWYFYDDVNMHLVDLRYVKTKRKNTCYLFFYLKDDHLLET